MKNIKIGFPQSIVLLVFLLIGSQTSLLAQITLPSIFTDNMVLQQNFEAPVWGWAEPGTKIIVSGSWSRMAAKTTVADAEGKWMIKIKTLEAGGPYELYINDSIIKNVMLGEVWICSGQSNMQMIVRDCANAKTEIEKANYPNIRFFYVSRDEADEPNKNCYGRWESSTPKNTKMFSAVAYFFGKELHEELQTPIGLINISKGGSSAEAWINYNVLQSTPEGQFYIEKYKKKIKNTEPGILPRDHHSPSSLYNGMLHPLIPFGIKGAIWYQGETNTTEHDLYKNLNTTLITSWRDEWAQGDFPFYFVQLAPFNYKQEFIGAALRDAQRKTLEVPNTGMAVTMDIGNPDNIHPKNKIEVGHRLALWALANSYGKENMVFSGPLYKSMTKDKKKIVLTFDHIGSGLEFKGDELNCFTIAGNDQQFYPAKANILNNTLLVSSKKVKNPVAVRFAFKNGDEPNFFNKEGLPASTFRTDNWELRTECAIIKSKYMEETAGFLISMYTDNENEIRYTLDGSEPVVGSLLYSEPFTVNDNMSIKAKVFINENASLLTSESEIKKHLATGKQLTYASNYDNRYDAGGDMGLVNSVFGSNNHTDGNWQGFQGKNLEVTIDLGQVVEVSAVSTNCLQDLKSWIVLPKQISILTSEDGVKFKEAATMKHDIPPGMMKGFIHNFSTQFEPTKAKYVKIIAKNYGVLPNWHISAGKNSWLFVDEIIVE